MHVLSSLKQGKFNKIPSTIILSEKSVSGDDDDDIDKGSISHHSPDTRSYAIPTPVTPVTDRDKDKTDKLMHLMDKKFSKFETLIT